jgi:hypothetical protein
MLGLGAQATAPPQVVGHQENQHGGGDEGDQRDDEVHGGNPLKGAGSFKSA